MNRNAILIRTLGVWAVWGMVQAPLALPLLAEDHSGHAHAQAGKKTYQCPMHPQIVRDAPGTCPICNMNLEEVELDSAEPGVKPTAGPAGSLAPADAAKSQPKAGGKPFYQCPMHPQIVREHPGTCPICYMELERMEADSAAEAPAAAGTAVAGKAGFKLSAERQQLIGVKVAKAELKSLKRTLRLAGRAGGGQVVAQLQELDSGVVKAGQAAWVVGPEGSSVKARVVAVDNNLDALTRCYAVLVSLASRPAWLRGGIYVDVHVVAELGKGLAVPRDAVFDTGERKVAFVRLGTRFEPRALALGAVGDEEVFIKDGVKAGEEVVVGANFLIDSEARFRAVAEQYK